MSGPDCGEAGHAEGRCGTAECIDAQKRTPCRSPYCECAPGKCTHPGCYDARGDGAATTGQPAPERRTGLEIRHTLTLRNGDTLTVILRPVVGEIPRAWEVFVNGGLLANGEESAVYRGQGCFKDAQRRALAEVYSAAQEAGEPM